MVMFVEQCLHVWELVCFDLRESWGNESSIMCPSICTLPAHAKGTDLFHDEGAAYPCAEPYVWCATDLRCACFSEANGNTIYRALRAYCWDPLDRGGLVAGDLRQASVSSLRCRCGWLRSAA